MRTDILKTGQAAAGFGFGLAALSLGALAQESSVESPWTFIVIGVLIGIIVGTFLARLIKRRMAARKIAETQ